jgi:hypothetical protein
MAIEKTELLARSLSKSPGELLHNVLSRGIHMGRIFCVLILLASCITANAQQAARPGQAQPRVKAGRGQTLLGRVVDEAGRPLFEAVVAAIPAGLTSKMSKFAALNMRSVTTDENGNFTFEEMATGAYRLMPALAGYTVAEESLEENGRAKYYRSGDTITIRMIKGGVITGTVMAQGGEPLVGVRLSAIKVKDSQGRAVNNVAIDERSLSREWKTDDRGIYRIYGLEPGKYLVSAGGKGFNPMAIGEFDSDAPTYYPTGTRDMASEVNVIGGQETSGIDIRYRENKGHIISGNITAANGATAKINIAILTLTNAATGGLEGFALSGVFGGKDSEAKRPFALTSIADGEYNLSAMSAGVSLMGEMAGETYVSRPHRVKVKGGDVTGLELALFPLGSISGQFIIEKAKAVDGQGGCPVSRKFAFEEVVIVARDDAKKRETPDLKLPSILSALSLNTDSVPDEKGLFRILTTDSSRYRLDVRLPSDDLYIRSITLPKAVAATPTKGAGQAKEVAKPLAEETAKPTRDGARNGITVKLGEKVENVLINAVEGAAALRGQIKAARENETLPQRLRIFLLPAEAESTDDVLRFFETDMQRDGSFAIRNIAPGRYYLITRLVNENAVEENVRPVAWDADLRKLLHTEAEAKNQLIELQTCQRVSDYVYRYATPAPAKNPK